MSYAKEVTLYHRAAAAVGMSYADAESLRRCAMTLHRWSEGECGNSNDWASWCIVRDEETGKTFREVHPHRGEMRREPIRDRETPAIERAKAIAARLGLTLEYQGDPRGWPLTLKTADGLRSICPPCR